MFYLLLDKNTCFTHSNFSINLPITLHNGKLNSSEIGWMGNRLYFCTSVTCLEQMKTPLVGLLNAMNLVKAKSLQTTKQLTLRVCNVKVLHVL